MCKFLEAFLPIAKVYKERPRQSNLVERGLGILRLEWRTGFSKVENQTLNKTKRFKRTIDSIINAGPSTSKDMEMDIFEHFNSNFECKVCGLSTMRMIAMIANTVP